MKKISLLLLITLIFALGLVYADTLIDSLNVSYTSEYTEKDNVKEALDELVVLSTKGIPTPPLIKGNLIPVKIQNDGTAKKVSESDPSWYDYDNKIWANAVELVSGAKYHKGQNDERDYQVGDTIPESDIRSYFVWIPKYKYRLWNVNSDGNSTDAIGPHSIEIEFDTTNTTDVEGISCATPLTSNGTGNCNNGEWMTHPAFISMNVDGFWVGKFEIGNKLNTTTAAKTAMTSSTVSNIVIKPDYYSWTSTTAIDYFNLLKTYNSDLDSHMIKNTEWGAVAYLSHSKYGKDSQVNINNNSSSKASNYLSKTGYSANPNIDNHTYQGKFSNESTYHTLWNTENGYRASTTGNISGIYDMVGGTHEYVAGIISVVSVSGDVKYYDLYNNSSDDYTEYKYRILGDATGEMGPFLQYADGDGTSRYHNWYSDTSEFFQISNPWLSRGGHAYFGGLTGLFCFYRYPGSARSYFGSRIVLSPTVDEE